MKYKLRGLFIGIILGAIVSSITAFATTSTLTKNVTYRNIKIVVDKNQITPTDANGNYVEPFIMDGTTYLPVRAVANAFGKDVTWDDATNTVSLEEQSVETEHLVGTYTIENYKVLGVQKLTLIINKDNTGSMTDESQTTDFTWVQNENQLTLTPVDTQLESAILTIDGNHLISEEDALYFTKIKENVSPKENGTSATLQKDVTYRDIKIVIDGNAITPTDANGNPVEPFIMDGTTYLPVRAVANAFGKEVGWDDATNTVSLGVQPTNVTSIVGTYVLESSDPTTTENYILILKENNKGSLSNGYDTVQLTWSQSGNTLTLIPPNDNENYFTLIIDGDRLISGDEGDTEAFIKTDSVPNPRAAVTMKTVTVDKSDADKPIVTIEMENGGIIKMELYPDVAPISVENFISLIEKDFYDGLTFHRNIPDFVIQGGCPVGNGTGGPGYTIKGEFSSNGVENNLKHTRGVLSMARAQNPDSAGSQFFIMHADAPHLDGEYAAFGKVIEGMDVVDAIATSGM